uniref:Protein phosphatase 1H-like n=1 Tax=Gouania willdenowi TaxID=441366 RepID=A0A8C5G8Z7_GOUWI
MSHDRREACVCVCACLFPCSLSPAPLLPLTPLIRTAVRAPSQTHTPLLDRSTMLTRVRSVVSSFMGGVMAGGSNGEPTGGSDLPHRFLYSRPEFLGLSPDEIECSADHGARPILILKENRRLPWCSGYAEVINAGKSTLNEDQACCEVLVVKRRPAEASTGLSEDLTFHYWGLFDGHAGSGAAVVASRLLHHHMALHLQEVMEILGSPDLLPPTCLGAAGAPGSQGTPVIRFFTEKKVSHESLVVGAIENAFKDMDVQIDREKEVYNISGGCTALVVVFLLGKLYVGNAGDSRAIIIRSGEVIPMSAEFTPESERQRLQFLAYMQPQLLGNEFTHLEFPRRVQKKEVGKRMLYRDFTMSGWAYKTVEEDDLKFPLIYGEGKKARVLATIGVTRGLGDHNLKVHDSKIYIKPFLSCCPEVRVYPLEQCKHSADDVLVLGTDGLWDVLSNQEVAEVVNGFLANCDADDQHRYTMAAQELVMRARGVLKDRGWRITNDRLGSGDDISVFIVPLMYGNKLNSLST